MGGQQYDITWVQTQLTLARWHLDAASSSTTGALQRNLQRSWEVCERALRGLSMMDVPAEQRETIERELGALRSRLQALRDSRHDCGHSVRSG